LAVHPHGDVPYPGPRVPATCGEPRESGRRRDAKPGEAECCSQEVAALVEHALLDHLVRPPEN
jgi:hypothetical protein